MSKVLALIPARGGSKRVPRKNVLPLSGLPLIGWSIAAARHSGVCVEVVVSTDDPEIADVAMKLGASVPELRPADLATDTAGSVDVALQALDRYEELNGAVDALLLLQPTSPFRSAVAIRDAVALFESCGRAKPVVSITPVATHPAWTFRLDDNGMTPLLGWKALQGRSQDLEPVWTLNGSIYVISPERLRKDRMFVTRDVVPFPMSSEVDGVDIDTWLDWRFAEAMIAHASIMTPDPFEFAELSSSRSIKSR
ncbi:acylneuraminate cytidylyltransferase family protein [Alcaligenaceae bacterium C4P045]|nr:acylneuraminate cytidylyltransferase family protein [Alcaligenaceae bacterium C4P045]